MFHYFWIVELELKLKKYQIFSHKIILNKKKFNQNDNGFGLCWCKKISNSLDYDLNFESLYGEGSLFSLNVKNANIIKFIKTASKENLLNNFHEKIIEENYIVKNEFHSCSSADKDIIENIFEIKEIKNFNNDQTKLTVILEDLNIQRIQKVNILNDAIGKKKELRISKFKFNEFIATKHKIQNSN